MSKMYQAQPAIPSPRDLPQPVSRYQPPPVSQQMPLPREREISGRSNSSSYDRFSLGLDHLKHLNLGPSERPGAQMSQNGASSPYYESAHGGDTQRDIFFNQNLPPKSAIGSWTNWVIYHFVINRKSQTWTFIRHPPKDRPAAIQMIQQSLSWTKTTYSNN